MFSGKSLERRGDDNGNDNELIAEVAMRVLATLSPRWREESRNCHVPLSDVIGCDVRMAYTAGEALVAELKIRARARS